MAIQEIGGAYLILRTSWVYGARGKNFFRTILRLAREREELNVVNDQIGCPTWSAVVAEAVARLLTSMKETGQGNIIDAMSEHAGVYNWAASGECSWYDFAVEILAADPASEEHLVQKVIPIPSSQFPTQARRPNYSVLATEKISSTYGLETRHREDQMMSCWEAIGSQSCNQ